ncbi:12808_t:CDS:1, partial [Funneliformis mosseae]
KLVDEEYLTQQSIIDDDNVLEEIIDYNILETFTFLLRKKKRIQQPFNILSCIMK